MPQAVLLQSSCLHWGCCYQYWGRVEWADLSGKNLHTSEVPSLRTGSHRGNMLDSTYNTKSNRIIPHSERQLSHFSHGSTVTYITPVYQPGPCFLYDFKWCVKSFEE